MKRTVLYVTYDGILEPLGRSQVLRYLERLAADHRIVLMSFEKSEDWAERGRREALRGDVRAAGITWIPLRCHKRPSAHATAYDIAHGIVLRSRLVPRYSVSIVHVRTYLPSLIALALKQLLGLKFVFHIWGF